MARPESRQKVELLDGEVFVSPSPAPYHQRVLGTLYILLDRWAEAHPPAEIGLAPLDLKVAEGRIVQPDLLVLAEGFPPGNKLPLCASPALVVEILSQNRAHDRLTKRAVYAQARIPEYWIVDIEARSVELISGLETLEQITSGGVTSRVLPDLDLPLEAFFARLPAI